MRLLLLLIPCVAALAVPLFNTTDPRLFGLPFFWWYQLAMIPLSAAAIAIVYLGDRQ